MSEKRKYNPQYMYSITVHHPQEDKTLIQWRPATPGYLYCHEHIQAAIDATPDFEGLTVSGPYYPARVQDCETCNPGALEELDQWCKENIPPNTSSYERWSPRHPDNQGNPLGKRGLYGALAFGDEDGLAAPFLQLLGCLQEAGLRDNGINNVSLRKGAPPPPRRPRYEQQAMDFAGHADSVQFSGGSKDSVCGRALVGALLNGFPVDTDEEPEGWDNDNVS